MTDADADAQADTARRVRAALDALVAAAGVRADDPADAAAARVRAVLDAEPLPPEWDRGPEDCPLKLWLARHLGPGVRLLASHFHVVATPKADPAGRAVVPLPECVSLAVLSTDGRGRPEADGRPVLGERACVGCGAAFDVRDRRQVYCGPACRLRNYRRGNETEAA